jgi:hypothetical protein
MAISVYTKKAAFIPGKDVKQGNDGLISPEGKK